MKLKRGNKKEVEVQTVEDVNVNILNIITPPGIDFSDTFSNVGENIGRIYCIGRYPQNVDYGWLASLCNLEGTITHIEYRYTSSERMQTVMNKKISELRTDRETAKQESERQQYAQGIKDLTEMINRIAVKQEPVGYVNIMLFPQAQTINELNSRIKRISTIVSTAECNLRLLKYRQDLATRSFIPM